MMNLPSLMSWAPAREPSSTLPPATPIRSLTTGPAGLPPTPCSQPMPVPSSKPVKPRARKRKAVDVCPEGMQPTTRRWNTVRTPSSDRTQENILIEWMISDSFEKQWNGGSSCTRGQATKIFNDLCLEAGIDCYRNQGALEDKIQKVEARYRGAVHWKQHTGAGIDENDCALPNGARVNISTYLEHLCPHFELLDQKLGRQARNKPAAVYETGAEGDEAFEFAVGQLAGEVDQGEDDESALDWPETQLDDGDEPLLETQGRHGLRNSPVDAVATPFRSTPLRSLCASDSPSETPRNTATPAPAAAAQSAADTSERPPAKKPRNPTSVAETIGLASQDRLAFDRERWNYETEFNREKWRAEQSIQQREWDLQERRLKIEEDREKLTENREKSMCLTEWMRTLRALIAQGLSAEDARTLLGERPVVS